MPIMQNEVQVTLTSNIISYYEQLGYEIPRYKDPRGRLKVKENTKIIVDIKHLKKGCGIQVAMACDECGRSFKRIWRDHKDRNGMVFCNKCSGILRRGENAYNWNSKLTVEDRLNGRDYPEYHDFIKRVLLRDNYTCKVCGNNTEKICVHHLDGYNWFVEGRTKDSNGVSLCEVCHNSFHSVYGKGRNTKDQFEEWIGQPVGELGEGVFPPARKVICMDDGSIIDSAPIAAKIYQLDRNSLYPVLNRNYRSLYNNHFLWYDDYLAMDKEDLNHYWRWVLGKERNSSELLR